MNKKIKISAVSYLNTFPFLYGISQNNDLNKLIEISTDYPSLCAQKLKNDIVDIGLVPIAILPEIKNYDIISDFCIAGDGKVKSVLLVSDVPLDKIKTVLLDYQSGTSINLAMILAQNYWHIFPNWQNAFENYESKINGKTAGVVIGDRALNLRNNFKYVYDLSEEWKKFTKLPFVFATWTANKNIPIEIIEKLNAAFRFGINNLEDTIDFFKDRVSDINYNPFEYLNKDIDYELDANKKRAINLYLNYLKEQKNKSNFNKTTA